MQPLRPPLRVRVPGSTSNLGAGFDVLGVALSLFREARLVGPSAGATHELRRDAALDAALADASGDLLLAAFSAGARAFGVEGAYRFEQGGDLPVGRGIGSSAAAIVAGLLLARALAAREVAGDELLALAVELEGHPDNAVPSLVGGGAVCHRERAGGTPRWYPLAVHPSIAFALVWPPLPMATARARAVLPTEVSLGVAVENAQRLAFLLEGLRSGRPELLLVGGDDRLHVPHRLPLIPGAAEGLAAGRAAGAWLATLSGSGSALLALAPEERIDAVAAAMAEALAARAGDATVRRVQPVLDPPHVEAEGA